MAVAPDVLGQRRSTHHGAEVFAGNGCTRGAGRVRGRPLLEIGARLRVYRGGILPVPIIEFEDVPGIQTLELIPSTHTELRFYSIRASGVPPEPGDN